MWRLDVQSAQCLAMRINIFSTPTSRARTGMSFLVIFAAAVLAPARILQRAVAGVLATPL